VLGREGRAEEGAPGVRLDDQRVDLGGDGAAERRVDLLQPEVGAGPAGGGADAFARPGGREGAALHVHDDHVGAGRGLGEHRHRHGRQAREERPRVAGAGQIVGEDRERHRARPS